MLEYLRKRLAGQEFKVGFPEGNDPRIQAAAETLAKESFIAEVHLFTAKPPTNSGHSKIHYVAPSTSKDATPLELAGQALRQGAVDLVIGGAVHPTADILRLGLKTIGLKENIKTMSSYFVLDKAQMPENFLFADCAVLVEPTAAQLVDVAWNSLEVFQCLFPDVEAKVAFLSFSTQGSAQHPLQDKVRNAWQEFKKKCPAVPSIGEVQFDTAFAPEVRSRKWKGEASFEGSANIYIFPNLDAGNIGYKMAQRLGGFGLYGPLLCGLRKPLSDLSRGANVNDIVMTTLFAAVQCLEVLD